MILENRAICPGCGNEIDPDWCHCGISITHSPWEGHQPVPMGCDCCRTTKEDDSDNS